MRNYSREPSLEGPSGIYQRLESTETKKNVRLILWANGAFTLPFSKQLLVRCKHRQRRNTVRFTLWTYPVSRHIKRAQWTYQVNIPVSIPRKHTHRVYEVHIMNRPSEHIQAKAVTLPCCRTAGELSFVVIQWMRELWISAYVNCVARWICLLASAGMNINF